ncbi:MAG: nucleoside diphosphate kinase regulator [Candidatus Omnitrophica bacterium]|nr:nucleoside diphosphate kinase regulator [Candidatus Omnitrophota bacterium]
MATKEIYITDNDMKRLRELIMVARDYGQEDEKDLKELEDELDTAKIVKFKDIPKDVITMNSEIHLLDVVAEEEVVYKLVFPNQANANEGKVSIMAPIGTALLGYSVGDVIEWKVPGGITRLKVEKILYQPEASEDYHL